MKAGTEYELCVKEVYEAIVHDVIEGETMSVHINVDIIFEGMVFFHEDLSIQAGYTQPRNFRLEDFLASAFVKGVLHKALYIRNVNLIVIKVPRETSNLAFLVAVAAIQFVTF